MRKLLIAFPLLVSCGTEIQTIRVDTQPKPYYGEPAISSESEELGLIVSEFYASASWLGKPVNKSIKTISFVDEMQDYAVGLCYIWQFSNGKEAYREIKLLRSYWDKATPQSKRVLIYHELGHCALSQEHAPVNSPRIMAPSVLLDKVSYLSWYSLVKDLFNPTRLNLIEDSSSSNDVIINQLD